MRRFLPALLLGVGLLAVLAARPAPVTNDHGVFAKLIVTVTGDPSDFGNYGWIWDNGERRNGRPWIGSAGTLGGDDPPVGSKGSNHLIYYWITDKGWSPRVGPTEVEILDTIGMLGWTLVAVEPSAHHPYVPDNFDCDRRTTYFFAQRRR